MRVHERSCLHPTPLEFEEERKSPHRENLGIMPIYLV